MESCYKIVRTKEEYEKILEENEYVFVIYSATWCGPCKSFKTWLNEEYKKYPHPILVIDVEELEELADEISGLPTLIVLHKKEQILKTEGFNKQKLKIVFDEYFLSTKEEKSDD